MPKYIDFDALGVQSCNPDVFENKGYATGWNSLIKILYDAPSADVEPKRETGRWIDLGDHLLCCRCGAPHTDPDKNYCSCCGARMMSDDEIADGIGQTFSQIERGKEDDA